MGPVLDLKYFRYTYRPSAINILQKAERSRGPMYTLVNLESQQLKSDKDTMMVPTSNGHNASQGQELCLRAFAF
jgi:phospholipid-translocating ATPase